MKFFGAPVVNPCHKIFFAHARSWTHMCGDNEILQTTVCILLSMVFSSRTCRALWQDSRYVLRYLQKYSYDTKQCLLYVKYLRTGTYHPAGGHTPDTAAEFCRSLWPRGLERVPRWLGHWDRGFESRSRPVCLCSSLSTVLHCYFYLNVKSVGVCASRNGAERHGRVVNTPTS
jgi:hypothetical protein